MNIKPLFSIPLGETDIGRDFTKEEMSLFLNELGSLADNVGNANSVNKRILENPLLSDLKEKIILELDNYVQEINPPRADKNITFYITQSWLNINRTGEWHHPHIHTNSVISGVLYINVKDGVDTTTFTRKPGLLFSNLVYFPEKETEYNRFYEKIPVTKGKLIFFPSNVEHYVDFNKDTHNRISLSFNVFLKGDLGSEDTLSKLDL
jgi:uncharacterized protein (TIGR02466 family)